jgi:hypothetical protein
MLVKSKTDDSMYPKEAMSSMELKYGSAWPTEC